MLFGYIGEKNSTYISIYIYIYIYSFSIRQYFWEYISEKVVKSWNVKFSKVFWRLFLPRGGTSSLPFVSWFFLVLPLQFLFLAFSFSLLLPFLSSSFPFLFLSSFLPFLSSSFPFLFPSFSILLPPFLFQSFSFLSFPLRFFLLSSPI